MPWKMRSRQEQRFELVRQMIVGRLSVTELCQRFRISRQTAYKWRGRYRQQKLGGLKDRPRRPKRSLRGTGVCWLRGVRRWRQGYGTWGARKLGHELSRRFGKLGTRSTATISRWLKRWGLSRGRARRRRGPVVLRRALRAAQRCHEVWTVDFKGWYRTAAGTRVEPLTVRDLHSRYGLTIALLRTQSIAATRREFRRIFARHGLPERIRSDNGSPFGGAGPTGLTRLSAWWIKLGVEEEFITPGRPCENGAHEQFHRVYKAEVAVNPARAPRAQQHRPDRWLGDYKQERPHQGLGMKRPVDWFGENRRGLPKRIGPWQYPKGRKRCWVKGNGEISWRGVRRFVGEAFVQEHVGLKPVTDGIWAAILVGELHEKRLAVFAWRSISEPGRTQVG